MTKYVNNNGVSEMWLNIKNWVTSQLLGYSQTGHTHSASDITSGLSTVATSGSYNDLSNKPTTMTPTSHTHGNITNDGKIGSNANKPLITTTGGTVTTGSFGTSANTFCEGNDSRLSDARTPTSHTHTKSEITDFPTLATVATSGSYNDLSNKPTIPTVNNATLTIQKNGTTVKTFTANASSNVTANITVPTKTSELTNDSGFLTSHQDLSGYVPRSGGPVLEGQRFMRTVNNSTLNLYGGTSYNNGAFLQLAGKDNTDAGQFLIQANNGSTNAGLLGKADGTLTWNSKNIALTNDVIPRSGGSVLSGTQISRTDASKEMNYCGGTNKDDGATLVLVGKNASSNAGSACIKPSDGANSRYNWMRPDGTWTWNGTACQILSDQRLKQQITEIDDKLLDAWEDVEPSQFKYNDAVDAKKDKARLHTGYVVQQIDEACKSHGVDISEYGLYCHEEYPQEVEEVEVEQEDGTKTKERKVIRDASEHYSLRYTEALIVECAYLRKCIKELRNEIEQLKSSK